MKQVAPHAGAWIETAQEVEFYSLSASRLMQARGLKLTTLGIIDLNNASRLMQARGLKPSVQINIFIKCRRASCRRVD